jgi:hypothetical protein
MARLGSRRFGVALLSALTLVLSFSHIGASPARAAGLPPVAEDQSDSTPSTPLLIFLDASDPESDPLAYTIVTPSAHGTLDDCGGGFCTYTPTAGYLGPDSFTWKANDGTSDSNVATFSLTVVQIWTALQIAQSIAAPSAVVTGASFVAVPPGSFANGVYSSALNEFPIDGATFGILTSGDVASVDQPGTFADTSNGGPSVRGNTDRDVSILKIDLAIPAGANCLSFNFKFLSEEFPIYVGSAFNDAFIAELDTSDWTTAGSVITAPHNFAFDSSNDVVSINSTGLGGMTPANGAGTAFDGTTSGSGTDSNGAATALLGAATPVTPGAHSIYLSIFDQGDTALDSAVFLDNLRVGSVPNPAVNCEPGATETADLTLTKSVTNTGGGTALATDWTLSATGPTAISGATGSAAVTNAVVIPGTYSLAETGPAGYSASAWSCTDGTLTGNSLVLAAGDGASCSITNTFIPLATSQLTLTKTVDNTGGGTALATDWTLSATGPTSISGATGSPAVTNAVVSPGTYTLAESGPAGYSASAWSCTDGTLTGSSLVLAAGDSASCSITNTFIPSPPNPPPTSNAGADKGGTEGSAISLDGTVTNTPASDTLAQTWSYVLGAGTDSGMTCTFANANAVDTTITCTDDGTVTITLTANDGVNPPVQDSAILTIANANPTVDITSPGDGTTVSVGQTVNLTASRGDPGSNDTHTCTIDWGDGTITTGTLTATTCTGSHAYASIGVPIIRVTITDDDGGSAFDEIMLVVATAQTKVTGGGWIALGDGKLRFGFVAHPGTPNQGEIQVRWGNHRFHGKTVSGLVVAGPNASWSGTGTYDGAAGYTYEVKVFDGSQKKIAADTFAIVIRDSTNTVVFSASGSLGGGNIKVR